MDRARAQLFFLHRAASRIFVSAGRSDGHVLQYSCHATEPPGTPQGLEKSLVVSGITAGYRDRVAVARAAWCYHRSPGTRGLSPAAPRAEESNSMPAGWLFSRRTPDLLFYRVTPHVLLTAYDGGAEIVRTSATPGKRER
jgi:hypothetical protein